MISLPNFAEKYFCTGAGTLLNASRRTSFCGLTGEYDNSSTQLENVVKMCEQGGTQCTSEIS